MACVVTKGVAGGDQKAMSGRRSRLFLKVSVWLVCVVTSTSAGAQSWSASRADSHAPLGVMGDHAHEAGEWMFSFRYMRMTMDGNRDGVDRLDADEVLTRFPVTPLRMPMNMFMPAVMYAPSDRVTLMGMVSGLGLSMDHRTRTGVHFTTETVGIGDVKLSALVGVAESGRQRWYLNLGVSLPTGQIDERGDTPVSEDVQLPYPMQLGSGTWDLMPGVTWLGQGDRWSWGAQAIGTVRIGTNERGYALGNRIAATTWGSWLLSDNASAALRLGMDSWGNIDGADSVLNPAMAPTANPVLRAGIRLNAGVGLNLYGRGDIVGGHRLALEFLVPVYQHLDGPQVETDWTVMFGWQKSFAGR